MTQSRINQAINMDSAVLALPPDSHRTSYQQTQIRTKGTFHNHGKNRDNGTRISNPKLNSMATTTTFPHPQQRSSDHTSNSQHQEFNRHPIQATSYDIKGVTSSSSRKDSMESRVNSLCKALAQEIDVWHSSSSSDDVTVTTTIKSKKKSITLEELMMDMTQMKLEFDKRLSQMIQDYEVAGAIVCQLNYDLQKKQEEINILRTKYETSVKENRLLYDAFNSEMAQLSTLVSTPPQKLSAEWQKKLDTTLKERNQWHQTACLLARELQDMTAYFGTTTLMANQQDDTSDPPSMATTKNSRSMMPQSSRSSPMII